MSRAWIVVMALCATSCAEFRNFTCFHCAQPTYAKEPGASTCPSCLRSNIWSVCPACGAEAAQPDPGPFRCSTCGIQAHATKCRTCSAVGFSREPGGSCAICVRPVHDPALKRKARNAPD